MSTVISTSRTATTQQLTPTRPAAAQSLAQVTETPPIAALLGDSMISGSTAAAAEPNRLDLSASGEPVAQLSEEMAALLSDVGGRDVTGRNDQPGRIRVTRRASVQPTANRGPSIHPQNQAFATQQAFAQQFTALAGSKGEFHSLMAEAFGPQYNASKAEAFRQKALAGDTSFLPPIRYLSDSDLQGGLGAFDKQAGVIYLSENVRGNPDLAKQVYAEEFGHFLDSTLNRSDTQGDEGEMFRRLIGGERLSAADKLAIRTDNDQGVISVAGKDVKVEFWSLRKSIKKAGNSIKKRTSQAAAAVKSAVQSTGRNLIAKPAKALGRAGSRLVDKSLTVFDKILPAQAGEKWYHKLSNVVRSAARMPIEMTGNNIRANSEMFQALGQGSLKRAWRAFLSGSRDAIGKPIGTLLNGIGGLVSMFRSPEHDGVRRLNEAERTHFREIYGDSLDLDAVKIGIGPTDNGRSHAHRDTLIIHMDPSRVGADGVLNRATLDHEMAHIWQYQNGGGNIFEDSTWNKRAKRNRDLNEDEVYEWSRYYGSGVPFNELNGESQAELIADFSQHVGALDAGTIFRLVPGSLGGEFITPVVAGTETPEDIALTAYLKAALRDVRRGRGAP